MLSADAKLAVIVRVPSLTKVWSTQFPVAKFSKTALFVSWTARYASATCEKLVICKCQCFYPFDIQQWSILSILSNIFSVTETPPEEIQLSVSCYVSILNFHSPKYLRLYRSLYLQPFGGTSQGPPKNVPYWRRETKVTVTSWRRHFQAYFLKCVFMLLYFQYWLKVDI